MCSKDFVLLHACEVFICMRVCAYVCVIMNFIYTTFIIIISIVSLIIIIYYYLISDLSNYYCLFLF